MPHATNHPALALVPPRSHAIRHASAPSLASDTRRVAILVEQGARRALLIVAGAALTLTGLGLTATIVLLPPGLALLASGAGLMVMGARGPL